jgi:UDP-N-acetylmuramoyl-L-alanyl-D-glutamate--2,6-diaminopimelate ligase
MLADLLYHTTVIAVHGDLNISVSRLETDSRKVNPGDCFIAIRGVQSDGNKFIEDAIRRGAVAVVTDAKDVQTPTNVTRVIVQDAARAAGEMCHLFYDAVSTKMKLVGVTGTNGKTTVATLLWKLFNGMGYRCGLISTVEYRIGEEIYSSTHTTPDVIQLYGLLNQMYESGCTHVFMECSSHAIHQQRIAGLVFVGAIFTNITHDHLDYHQTFDEYIRVKKSWFDGLTAASFAISNADDRRGAVMLQGTKAKKFFYSLQTLADVKGKVLDNVLSGLHMMVDHYEVHFRLTGIFNAYNILAVYAAAVKLGEQAGKVLEVMSAMIGAEGRFECLRSPQGKLLGIIDYAHTPDALINVLATINHMRSAEQRIITVVGCGGDRDKAKRPVMAEVACTHSDKVLLTSDNPRTEDPLEILKDMEAGIKGVAGKKSITIADRREAIKTAVNLSNDGDIILVAGKGHEKYQEINGVRLPFDDKKILTDFFELLDK